MYNPRYMLVNFSNHPSKHWSQEQLDAAHEYGEVIDEPFPSVPPDADEEEINMMANACVLKLVGMMSHTPHTEKPSAVHIMGEMTLTFATVKRLAKHGINCLASTTRREVTFDKDGNKVATFQFVKFRKYEM